MCYDQSLVLIMSYIGITLKGCEPIAAQTLENLFRRYSAVLIFFFFSSRRRHTRFDCDWSSDVCSSDLVYLITVLLAPHFHRVAKNRQVKAFVNGVTAAATGAIAGAAVILGRRALMEIGRASCRERV